MALTDPYFEDHDGSYHTGYYCPRCTWYCDGTPTNVLSNRPPFCEDGDECVLQSVAIKVWRFPLLLKGNITSLEWE